jgi:hypothetical protein
LFGAFKHVAVPRWKGSPIRPGPDTGSGGARGGVAGSPVGANRNVYRIKPAFTGQTVSMMEMTLGALTSVATIAVLAWDWWQHPTL